MNKKIACVYLGTIAGLSGFACAPPASKEAVETVETRRGAITGTWTSVALPFPSGQAPGNIALLTDGRVLVSGPFDSSQWWALTPDPNGSYENGGWGTQLNSSPFRRWANPAYILRDGRFWIGGGEVPTTQYRGKVDLFDPATNTWSTAPDMPQEIADTPTQLLGDGRLLVLSHWSTNSYLFDSYQVTARWLPAAPWSTNIGDQESSTQILPDGSVIAGSRAFQRYLPATDTWVDTALPPGGYNALMLPSGSDEVGPIVLLHDGRALVLGGNNRSALYTAPAVSTDPGTWTAAPDLPPEYSHGDAPSAVEPDGRALTVATTDSSGLGLGTPVLYEYDPPTNSWQVISTPAPFLYGEWMLMLVLPTGQMWVSGYGSPYAWLYRPAGAPQTSWRPTITSVPPPSFGEFTVNGVQLNGLTTGGDWGDDFKTNTNYPLVWLTDAANHVTYCRTYNFDQMVPRPNMPGSTQFAVPSSLADGSYTLHLAANGVEASNTVPISFSGPRVISLTGPTRQNPGMYTLLQVRLAAAAPAGGVPVNLISTLPSVASVPATVTVPEGMTSINFQINSLAYGKTTIKAATAANGRFAASQGFNWAVTGLSGPSVPSGGSATWTVTLDQPAFTTGVVVNLQSSDPSAATVPATVTVPSGASSATFQVTQVTPGAPTMITASLLGSSRNGPFGYSVQGVSGPAVPPFGASAMWTVTLSAPAGQPGVEVSLQSSNPAAATVAPTVTVPAGTTSVNFPVTVVDASQPQSTITASLLGSSQSAIFGYTITAHTVTPIPLPIGGSSIATVTLNGNAPPAGVIITLQNLFPTKNSISTTSIAIPEGSSTGTYSLTGIAQGIGRVRGRVGSAGPFLDAIFNVAYAPTAQSVSGPPVPPSGNTATWTVTVNGATPPQGAVVSLQSSNPSAASVPATVTVPSGATSATFPVTMLDPLAPSTITATLGGVSTTGTFGYAIVSQTPNPLSISVGNTSLATVTINGPAPTGGLLITLQNLFPTKASGPPSLTIPAGSSTGTYTVTGLAQGISRFRGKIGSTTSIQDLILTITN